MQTESMVADEMENAKSSDQDTERSGEAQAPVAPSPMPPAEPGWSTTTQRLISAPRRSANGAMGTGRREGESDNSEPRGRMGDESSEEHS